MSTFGRLNHGLSSGQLMVLQEAEASSCGY